jgi:hypothetical protein
LLHNQIVNALFGERPFSLHFCNGLPSRDSGQIIPHLPANSLRAAANRPVFCVQPKPLKGLATIFKKMSAETSFL